MRAACVNQSPCRSNPERSPSRAGARHARWREGGSGWQDKLCAAYSTKASSMTPMLCGTSCTWAVDRRPKRGSAGGVDSNRAASAWRSPGQLASETWTLIARSPCGWSPCSTPVLAHHVRSAVEHDLTAAAFNVVPASVVQSHFHGEVRQCLIEALILHLGRGLPLLVGKATLLDMQYLILADRSADSPSARTALVSLGKPSSPPPL